MIDVTTASDEFLDLIASGTVRTDDRTHAEALLERRIRAAHRLIRVSPIASSVTSNLPDDLATLRCLWGPALSSVLDDVAIRLNANVRVIEIIAGREVRSVTGHDAS